MRSKKKKTPTNLLIRTLDTSNNLAGLQLTFVMLRAQMIHQHSSHIDERRVPARVGIWTRDSSIKRGNHRASRAEEEEREGEGETTGNTFSVETDDEAIAGG